MRLIKPLLYFIAIALLLALYLQNSKINSVAEVVEQVKLPEFTHSDEKSWINSAPITVESLKGKVVLIDVWTFACWNCYRSFPWLNELEARYKDKGLQVIGVHSPEFERERIRSEVEKKVKEFGLKHPVMIDNEFTYWKALNNRYWPAFYLVDKKGFIRATFAGETHRNTPKAIQIEDFVKNLLAE